LSGRLVERFGSEAPSGLDGVERAFPTPAVLARIAIAELSAVGVPRSRALTIVELSRAVEEGRIDLSGGDDPEGIIAALQSLQGVGPWTAHYLAMRALRWPDAFPAGDRGIRMAFGVSTDRAAEARAEAWRPWRAYGAMRLWGTLAKGG
jgi:AraC family transcriptional regulator of adaptative response / DNA-3-methyladenine glycosylase II